MSLTSPKVVRTLSGLVRTTACGVSQRRRGKGTLRDSEHTPTREVCPTTSWDTVARPMYIHVSLPGLLTCTRTGSWRYISLIDATRPASERSEGQKAQGNERVRDERCGGGLSCLWTLTELLVMLSLLDCWCGTFVMASTSIAPGSAAIYRAA